MHGPYPAEVIIRRPMELAQNKLRCAIKVLCVVRDVLGFSGVFDLHVSEFLRVENLTTLQALDIFRVLMPGDDSYFGMSAGGCHRPLVNTRSDALFGRL